MFYLLEKDLHLPCLYAPAQPLQPEHKLLDSKLFRFSSHFLTTALVLAR